MVTTRITDATPITMPSAVSTERIGLARKACALNLSDSPRNIGYRTLPHLTYACHLTARLLKQLFRLRARRIVGREPCAQVLPQQLARGFQIAAILDVGFGLGEDDFGAV